MFFQSMLFCPWLHSTYHRFAFDRYDLGLIGGAMLEISKTFNITNDTTKEAIVGAAKLGAFVGTFLGGALMLRYGRRNAIALQALFFTLGPVMMAGSTGPGYGISIVINIHNLIPCVLSVICDACPCESIMLQHVGVVQCHPLVP